MANATGDKATMIAADSQLENSSASCSCLSHVFGLLTLGSGFLIMSCSEGAKKSGRSERWMYDWRRTALFAKKQALTRAEVAWGL